jgi:hypothetical protein
MKKISFTLLALSCLFSAFSQTRSTFESFSLAPNSYYNGSNQAGGFLSGAAYYTNSYDTAYGGYWSGGFSYSNVKNDTTAGFTNEYASSPASGAFGSNNYTVAYTGGDLPVIRLQGFAPGHPVYGFYVTNSTYAYLSMKNGDQFAKKFGGASGTDPDWFLLTVKGWRNGSVIADSVNVYLADFRSSDSTQDYILKTWKFVDLQSLGNVDSIFFEQTSSDAGTYGMNTPAYFCLDNFMTTDGAAVITNPVALDDSASTIYTDSVIIHVLANDTVSTFLYRTLTITSGPQVSGATAYFDANGNLVYIPVIGLRTTDTLYYSYCDEFNVCTVARVVITINGVINAGINETAAATLDLYPNPSASRVTVSSTSYIQSLSIMDMSGREVLAKNIGQHFAALDISSLSAGVYTVLTQTTDGVVTKRLVKE